MDTCCSTFDDGDQPCPSCARVGPVVGQEPVLAHNPEADAGPWRYCPFESCPVAFHLGATTVTGDALVAQVGSKGSNKVVPVCFCFAHTAIDIARDLDAHHATSTIKASVRAAVADGTCACAYLNPTGTCCLPSIRSTITAHQAEAATRSDVR